MAGKDNSLQSSNNNIVNGKNNFGFKIKNQKLMKIIEISYYFNNYPYMQNHQNINVFAKLLFMYNYFRSWSL